MEERKRKLLKRLEKELAKDEEFEETSLFTAEELNAPMDVLRALVTEYGMGLMDVLAECSFLPIKEAEEVWYFSVVLTLSMNVPASGMTPLAKAISRLNFYLPCGAFCLSKDGKMLIYKLVLPCRTDAEEDTLFNQMKLGLETALLVPESYTDLLMRVLDGRLALADFMEALP
ncbi:MAG: hypothetical protein IJU50_01610 [Lachnospiraceae bacterium]|nr:hypothetical protein [Lachnospiraceae bacterium]